MELRYGLERSIAGLGLPLDFARDMADVACPQHVERLAAGTPGAARTAQFKHAVAIGGGHDDLEGLAGLAQMAESSVECRGVAGRQRVLDILQPVAAGDPEQAGESR